MSTAFEGLCETFNLPDEAKGERERLAKKIIAKGVNVNAQMTQSYKDNMRNRFMRIGQ